MSKQLLLMLLLFTLGVTTWEEGALNPSEGAQSASGSGEEDGQVRAYDGLPLPP